LKRLSRLLLYVGIIGSVLGLSKIHAAYVAEPPYSFTGSFRFAWAIAYMAVLAIAAYGVGLPDLPRTVRSALLSALGASAGAALGMSVVQLIVGGALLPRFVVFGAAIALIPWYLFCVAIASGGRVLAQERDRVAIIASPSEVALLQNDLALSAEHPAAVVVVLSPEGARGMESTHHPVIDAVSKSDASVVVVSREALSDERIVDQVAALHEQGLRIRTLSMFYEQWLGKLPISELERVSLLFDIGEVHRARYGRAKRLIDLAIGVLGMLVLIFMIPFVFLANVISNRGPLFYSQPRVGKNDEEFLILKFRTMRPEPAGQLSNEWTKEDDPRITSFGRILRASHLDELPQMLNIVRGDLAVVGPRPEQVRYVAELEAKLPFYDLRHLVRPGLTGWAQVKYGYAGDENDALEKLQYEFYYLRHQSLGLDLRIIARTIRSVVSGAGR